MTDLPGLDPSREEMDASPVEWLPGGPALADLTEAERDALQAEVDAIEAEAERTGRVGH